MEESIFINDNNDNVSAAPMALAARGLQVQGWPSDANITLADIMVSSGLGAGSRWFEPDVEAMVASAFCLLILLGVVGNTMVIVLLCRRCHVRRSPSHWYLLNLMVSDLLICVLCVPFTVLQLTVKDWRFGEAVCRLAPFLQQAYVLVSILTILAIAVERYRAIVCSTHQTHSLDGKRGKVFAGSAGIVIPAIWILSLGLATPMALTHKLDRVYNLSVNGEEEVVLLTLCVETWDSDALLAAYTVVILLLHYALPAVTIIVLHLLICRFLRRSQQQMQRSCTSFRKLAHRKASRHRKNLVLLTVISLTFGLEWLPITVVNIIADIDHSVFPSARAFCLTYALCLMIAFISVFVNPVVYGCFNSNFRRDVCCRKANGNGDTQNGAGGTGRVLGTIRETTSRFFTTVVGSSSVMRGRSVSVDSSGRTFNTTPKSSITPSASSHPDIRHVVLLQDSPDVPTAPGQRQNRAHCRFYKRRCISLDVFGSRALLASQAEGVKKETRKYSLQPDLERVIE